MIQATARLLCTLLNGSLIPTFYKLNIHAGMYICNYNIRIIFCSSLISLLMFFCLALSPKEIREFFTPIIELADHLLEMHNTKQIKGLETPPVVTVSS